MCSVLYTQMRIVPLVISADLPAFEGDGKVAQAMKTPFIGRIPCTP
jgi:hypothetical protein